MINANHVPSTARGCRARGCGRGWAKAPAAAGHGWTAWKRHPRRSNDGHLLTVTGVAATWRHAQNCIPEVRPLTVCTSYLDKVYFSK